MIKSFHAISAILTKAVVFADEKGLKHEDLLTSRLAADMRPYVTSFITEQTDARTPSKS